MHLSVTLCYFSGKCYFDSTIMFVEYPGSLHMADGCTPVKAGAKHTFSRGCFGFLPGTVHTMKSRISYSNSVLRYWSRKGFDTTVKVMIGELLERM